MSYAGTDRRHIEGDLPVGERLYRLESALDKLNARITYLTGAIATGGIIVALVDLYLKLKP